LITKAQANLAALVVGLSIVCQAASAHTILKEMHARSGYQEYISLMVSHGCGNSPTKSIRVRIPPEVSLAVPEEKPGWDIRIVKRPAGEGAGSDKPAQLVDELVWFGGELRADVMGVFNFLARLPDDPGAVIYFKTIQTCVDGEYRWLDTVPSSEEPWKNFLQEQPAPWLQLVEPERLQLGITFEALREIQSGQKATP
jgi:uncharacterized protein YcnI